MKISRGDILYADLGVSEHGSIQSGVRPVVVVSNNRANRHSTVLTVVPLTTKTGKKNYLPTHVYVPSFKSVGLDEHSLALCEQVTALDQSSIIQKVGKVSGDILKEITRGVQVQVGVFEAYN